MRAIAVAAILLNHAGMPRIPGGYVGVDVFFVVSGFLITGHLAEELSATGRISLADFYTRRARRILPAAFAVIVLTVVAAIVLQPPLLLPNTLRDAAAAAVYLPNLRFAAEHTDYFKPKDDPSAFQHYWSLGLEEQFYLVWPLLILLAFVLLGRARRGVVVMLTAVSIASFLLSVYLTHRTPLWAFFLLHTRAWEFAIGGLLAIATTARRWPDVRTIGLLGWIGLALIAYAVLRFGPRTPFPGWRAAVPVIGTALVIVAGTAGIPPVRELPWSPRRLLSTPPMLFMGMISYSVYLVHWPLLVITQDAVGLNRPLPKAVTLALGALAIPLGYLLYRVVEKPCRNAPVFASGRNRRTLAIASAVSIALAGASAVGAHVARARTLDAGLTAAASPLEPFPRGTAVVPSNLEPPLWDLEPPANLAPPLGSCKRSSGEDQTIPRHCEVGTNPYAPRVLLFGDSHASHFYPALSVLAEAGDIRLDTMTKGGCRTVWSVNDNSACALWRGRVISMLGEDPPDIILLGNRSFLIRDWATALPATIARLPKRSRIVVIADTPDMGSSMPVCLSAHLRSANSCSRPRQEAFNAANHAAERRLGLDILDVTDYLCNDEYCPPIIGNRLVYLDYGHLSEPFSEALAPVVRRQLLG